MKKNVSYIFLFFKKQFFLINCHIYFQNKIYKCRAYFYLRPAFLILMNTLIFCPLWINIQQKKLIGLWHLWNFFLTLYMDSHTWRWQGSSPAYAAWMAFCVFSCRSWFRESCHSSETHESHEEFVLVYIRGFHLAL